MNEAALRGRAHPRVVSLRLASDSRLVRGAVRGERHAFAAIFQRYHQELYRYCRAILADEEEAGDALQNTMLKVMRALPGERREIALRPWLYRIAHNESVALLRQRRPSAELGDEAATVAGALPEETIETREHLRQLVDDLRCLPDRQRGALLMRELNALDYAAIGAVFGTSAAVARQTVYEARIALQEMDEGREMGCEAVRKALSDGDGRILRGRRLRAHLRTCEGCRDFQAGIRRRKADLALLAPPLPALAASGMLEGILGSSHAGGGAGGLLTSIGGGGKVVAGSGVLKSAAAVVAAATLAVGAGDIAGVVHPPLISGSNRSAPGAGAAPVSHPAGPEAAVSASQSTGSAKAKAASDHAKWRGEHPRARSHGRGAAGGRTAAKGGGAGHAPPHPSGPPSASRAHSDFGRSHAPANPSAAAEDHPAHSPSAKASRPAPRKSALAHATSAPPPHFVPVTPASPANGSPQTP